MPDRREEKELISRIREFKREFRASYRDSLAKEIDERSKRGEVFYKGLWIGSDRLPKVLKRVRRTKRLSFLEIHLLIVFMLAFDLILWRVFKKFLLPY